MANFKVVNLYTINPNVKYLVTVNNTVKTLFFHGLTILLQKIYRYV